MTFETCERGNCVCLRMTSGWGTRFSQTGRLATLIGIVEVIKHANRNLNVEIRAAAGDITNAG